MKKRILANLLCLCLLLSLLPTAALASTEEGSPPDGTETVETVNSETVDGENSPADGTETGEPDSGEPGGGDDSSADGTEADAPDSGEPGGGESGTETGEDTSKLSDDTSVDATSAITRAQMAEMVYEHKDLQTAIDSMAGGSAPQFSDIDNCTNDQKAAITALCRAKIISGTSGSTFNPSGTITRGEFAVVLWRATGSKATATKSNVSFNDVSPADWYAPAIEALAAAGIIQGGSTGDFSPNGTITVVAVHTLLERYQKSALDDLPTGALRGEMALEAYNKYKDSPYALAKIAAVEDSFQSNLRDIDDCAANVRDAILFFEKLGIVNGYNEPDESGKTPFYPDVPASNLQIASFLMKCAQLDTSSQVALLMVEPLAAPTSDEITERLISQLKTQFGESSTIVTLASTNPNAPGTQNNLTTMSGSLVPAVPTISVSADGQVTITAESDTVVYYTTGESDPTVESTQYTAAFALNEASTIKAVAVKNSLYSEVATYTKQTQEPEPAALSIAANKASLNGGGDVTLTVDNIPAGATASVTCSDTSIAVDGSGNTWTATLPNTTADYTFTVTAGNETATCTVSVTRRSSGGGGSSSGGSSSSNTTTETVTNKDGSKTTTVTNKTTGTVTETTRNTDGSTLVVETRKDGTVTTTDTAANGVKVKTVDEPGEDVTAAVTIPRNVGTATVTIPADVDYGMVAVNADTGEIVKLSVPTEDGMTVKLDGSTELVLVDNAKHFTDARNHWAEDAIDFATAHELFAGTSDTTFTPDSPMTRAMLMTVLARFDDHDTSGGAIWYEKGMEWAKANGVSDGSNPNGSITREQLAAMLWRYAGSPAAGGSLTGFSDVGNVSGYATDAMRWAVSTGIIGGMGNGTLAPQGKATRAQVATMLMRFTENLTK